MSHKIVLKSITHWHEHEVHDRISKILGYDTWKLGTAKVLPVHDPNYLVDLTLEFPSREDYERCQSAIAEACSAKQ